MDKFVVRKPRTEITIDSPKKGQKGLKQMTIGQMKGVVVVEHILRLKSLLKVKDQNRTTLIEALRELHAKVPSREVLLSTKIASVELLAYLPLIGRTVNKLTLHGDDEVSRLATGIVNDWKAYHVSRNNRPTLDVKCDHKTEKHREAGRKLLTGALDGKDTKALAEAIEREAFNQHGHLLNSKYRRTMKNLVFKLKQSQELRDKVMQHKLSAKDLVKTHKDP